MTAQGNTGARLFCGGRASVKHGKATNSMRRTHQRGIAIGPILYIVAILAVLVSAIAAGSGSFSGDISAVNDKAMAAAIIEMGQQYKYAVDRVLANGYTDTQVSFEDPSGIYGKRVDGGVYGNGPSQGSTVNPDCSVDSCKIFKPSGGGIAPHLLPLTATVEGTTSYFLHPQSMVAMSGRVIGLGSETGAEGSELIIYIGWLKKSVCMKINDLLGITNPNGGPPFELTDCSGFPFTGAYSNCSNPVGDSPELLGKQEFCYSNNGTGGPFYFYRVLIVR